MGRDGTPDHTWPEDIRSSKRFPKKSNANATNNLAVPVGRVPRAHRLILEYQKKAPLPWCLPARSRFGEGRGEDEGEGGTKFGVSTPTPAYRQAGSPSPIKGEGVPGEKTIKIGKRCLIIL